MLQPFAPPHDARLPRTWRRSIAISSPLLNSLALTAASCLFVGLVYGALLFVFQPPSGFFASVMTFVQGTLGQHRTWGLGQGLIAWFGPSLDALEGTAFGLNPVSMMLILFFCFLIAGLVFRATQRTWSSMGYDQTLRLWRWIIGAIGLLIWPFACLAVREFIEAPLIASFGSHWAWASFFWFLTAWLSFAGFHLWASPPNLAFRALGLGGLVSAISFFIFSNTLLILVLTRLPAGFVAQSLGFVAWLFFFWFSFWLGMLVLSRYTAAKPSLSNADMATRLRLAFSVLSLLSGRAIQNGRTDHTTQEVYSGLGQSRANSLIALEFLNDKGYVTSKRKWFGTPIGPWSLSRSLDGVSMKKILGDLRASLHTGQRRLADPENELKGMDALIALETKWSNQSVAQFLAWPGLSSDKSEQSITRKLKGAKASQVPDIYQAEQENLMAAKPELMVQLEENQRPWFEPEIFAEAFHRADNEAPETVGRAIADVADAGNIETGNGETDQILMGEIRSAISKVRQNGADASVSKATNGLGNERNKDLEAIIRRLSPT